MGAEITQTRTASWKDGEMIWDPEMAFGHHETAKHIRAVIDTEVAIMAENHDARKDPVEVVDEAGMPRMTTRRRHVRHMRVEAVMNELEVERFGGATAVEAFAQSQNATGVSYAGEIPTPPARPADVNWNLPA